MNSLEQKEMPTFNIRSLNKKDLPQIMAVERSAWEPEWQATEDKFAARIKTFPEGVIGIFSQEQLAGMTTSMIFDFDIKKLPDYHKNWQEITGDGYITTHNFKGNALYVVSVAVHEDFQGQGLGTKLVMAQKELARRKKLDFVVLGARIPGFREYLTKKYPDKLSVGNELEKEARTYLFSKRDDGKPVDPEIRFYHSYSGFRIGKLIADFGPDEASCNFGVLVLWKNLK